MSDQDQDEISRVWKFDHAPVCGGEGSPEELRAKGLPVKPGSFMDEAMKAKPEMVDHPDHYTRGPKVTCPECEHTWTLECIEVIRHIRDGRLFTAMKYLWRVSFGGKWDDHEDIEKSHWYGNDYLEHPIDTGGQ